MKKRRMILVAAAVLLPAVFMACGQDERLENELAYRQIGINNMDDGNYEDALIAFSTALEQRIGKITDTEMDICYYKAAAQYASGDEAGALDTYNAIIDYNRKEGKAYFLRGSIYLANGDAETARNDFKDAVKYGRKEYQLYIQIYEKLAAHNMQQEGEDYLNQAFALKGNDAYHLENRGRIYYLLGQYDNAKKELTAAIEKESVLANLYLAQVYDAQGDHAGAEPYYQAYLSSGEADSTVMNALAEIEIGKGNYQTALEYVSQGLAMEKVPNKRALLYNQVIACEHVGDFAAAWTSIQEYAENYSMDADIEKEYLFLKNRQGIKEPVQTQAQTEDSEDGGDN